MGSVSLGVCLGGGKKSTIIIIFYCIHKILPQFLLNDLDTSPESTSPFNDKQPSMSCNNVVECIKGFEFAPSILFIRFRN